MPGGNTYLTNIMSFALQDFNFGNCFPDIIAVKSQHYSNSTALNKSEFILNTTLTDSMTETYKIKTKLVRIELLMASWI